MLDIACELSGNGARESYNLTFGIRKRVSRWEFFTARRLFAAQIYVRLKATAGSAFSRRSIVQMLERKFVDQHRIIRLLIILRVGITSSSRMRDYS